MSNDDFEVMPAGQMQDRYGLTAERRPTIVLDPNKVPFGLRELIPLAERFGVSDDLIRVDVLAKTPAQDVSLMKAAVQNHRKSLNEWLAGPESDGPNFSDEYIAFTCLKMAADGF